MTLSGVWRGQIYAVLPPATSSSEGTNLMVVPSLALII